MLLTAPEIKGRALEEMDEVFDSGIPALRKMPVVSRLDQLQKVVEAGNLRGANNVGSEYFDRKTQ